MSTDSEPAPQKHNTALIIVSAVGGVLLLALVAVIFLLIGLGVGSQRAGNPTGLPSVFPSASPGDPSASPSDPSDGSASPSPLPTIKDPPKDKTVFTSFKAPSTVLCDAGNGDSQPPKPPILVSWTSINATEAWYSPGNQDAKDKNYMRIPVNGNQDNFTDEHLFPCFDQGPSRDYTITLVGPHGEHVSKTWTVTDLSR